LAALADIIIRDVIANRPAAGNAGRLFYATDTQLLYRDNGAAWESYSAPPGAGGTVNGSGLFSGLTTSVPTRAATGLTTAYNQSGTYAVADNSNGIGLSDTVGVSSSALNLEGQLGAYPATPFTRTALFSLPPSAANYIGAALVIADSPTGKALYGGSFFNSSPTFWSPGISQANSPTSWDANVSSLPYGPFPFVWMKLVDDGTNIEFFVSSDGVMFVPIGTAIAKASSWLGASGFNYLGFAISTQGGPSISTLMTWQ
jgi:hypothetical protein